MTADWQIAQLNVAIPRRPLDSPALAEFVAALAPVNALADAAPGFVWRLADESGDATSIRAFGDERLIVNMSVWEIDRGALGVRLLRAAPRCDAAPARVDDEDRRVAHGALVGLRGSDSDRRGGGGSARPAALPRARAVPRSRSSTATRLPVPRGSSRPSTVASPAGRVRPRGVRPLRGPTRRRGRSCARAARPRPTRSRARRPPRAARRTRRDASSGRPADASRSGAGTGPR